MGIILEDNVKGTAASPSVGRALSILEVMATHPNGMSISELSRALNEAKSSLFAVLQTMQEHDFVVKDPVTKRYNLGPQLLVIGMAYARQTSLLVAFQSVAPEVVDRCGETLQLAILRGRHILYIGKQEGKQPVRLAALVGEQLPAHATSLGKAILSGLTDDALDKLFAGVTLEKLTPHTVTDLVTLKQQLAEVRSRGYAFDRGEVLEEGHCVGAPIRNAAGDVIAAISISVLYTRMTEERRVELGQLLRDCAQRLSRQFGYAG